MMEMFRFLTSVPGIDVNVRSSYNKIENLPAALIQTLGDNCIDVIRLLLKVGVRQIKQIRFELILQLYFFLENFFFFSFESDNIL